MKLLFSTSLFDILFLGDIMKVKCFDESHERDLEEKINSFLSSINADIIDIKYAVSASVFGEEQIYCFSAMIVYSMKNE